jgi:hypothetical protein
MRLFPRKRFLIRAGSVIGLLIVALLALPFLIDLNGYKATITQQVKQATGRELQIQGPIRLSLLPLPEVTLDEVRFANAPGAKGLTMAEVKSAVVRLSLPSLLTGTIAASEVTLLAPRINFEIDAAGQANWAFVPTSGGGGTLPVEAVRIEGGMISFSDARTGRVIVADRLDLSASAASMTGPFALTGSASVDDQPVKVELSLGAKETAGHRVDLALDAGGGRLAYKGSVSELGPGARLAGQVSASADNLVVFVKTLARIAGQEEPHVSPLLAGKFQFDGPVMLSRIEASAREFALVMAGQDKVTGSFAATLEPELKVDARLAAQRLDIDHWLKQVVLPVEAKIAMEAEKLPKPPAPAETTVHPARAPWLPRITAKLALQVGEAIYNQQPVRNIAVELDALNGVVAVPKFDATLPGDLVVRASSTMSDRSARPRVSGEFSLEGSKLRETLAWLGADVSMVPPDRLTRVSLRGRMASRDGDVRVEDAVFELDNLRGKAGITVAFTIPLSVELQLDLGTIDLDSFIRPGAEAGSTQPRSRPLVPLLALLGPSLGLKLKVARINYRGEVVSGLDLDVARKAGTLKLNDLKVVSLAGARLEVRGAVDGYWTPLPSANVVYKFDAPDIDRVLKLAGAPPTGFGAVLASGAVAGTWESLELRHVAVSAMGSSVEANGTFAVAGVPERKITSMSYKGHAVVDGQSMTVALSAADLAGRPKITADVRTDALDFDRFLRGGSQRRPASRASPRGRADTAGEIDTSAFRSVDGSFHVTTGAPHGSPARGGNTEIAAELKDGRLTITHLKGAYHGGWLDLAGVVDAHEPALSFELKGEATGFRIGEMMREGGGGNEIGSFIKIRLDGTLNVSDIVVRGTGRTAAQLKSSLAGSARVNGFIHPSADQFMSMIGSAAASVTGDAINLTLGNVARLFGDKGGIGAGNTLNAASLVLNRFVNRDNPFSGEIDIAHGVLTDRRLQVQGSGATANVFTRTSLESSTTDTTINFNLSEEPSLPYLIVTARGPLDGPSISVTRGGARDPPGMKKIWSDVEKIPSILPSISLPSFHIPNPFGR